MRRIIALSMLVGLFFVTTKAQHTRIFTNSDYLFNQGKELFSQRKYVASCRNFEQFLKTASQIGQTGQIQEAEYYLASIAYEVRQTNAADKLHLYLEQHAYTPFRDKVLAMSGILLYEKKQFDEALSLFNQVNENRLDSRERVDFLFCKAYSYLEVNNYAQALPIFKELKELKTRYTLSSTYYHAYAQYALGNYDVALPEFLKIEENPIYKNIVPYYIVQIYYSLKEFDKLADRTEHLLNTNTNNQNNAEIFRISGELAYQNQDYEKAISQLKKYESMVSEVLRNDLYMLGLSYFKTGNFSNAVDYLSRTTTINDEMTQNAQLYIGSAYVELKDLSNARSAFEASLQSNLNQAVREEALFNFALATYETSSIPGESIRAFEALLSEFPDSKYADQANEYIASAYITTKNYDAAFQFTEKVRQPTGKLLETKEFLLYQIGTEAFAQNDLEKAIQNFSRSLSISTTGKYSAECYYWRSECYFRTSRSEASIADLKAFFANPNAASSANYIIANYGMGYAHFSRRGYSQSLDWFLKYVNAENPKESVTYSDALNRIGDCYFYARNFEKAEKFYNKAVVTSPNTGDYALFQSAYVLGLLKNYSGKIEKLEHLLSRYPNSEYGDDALYEMGRAYVMMENNEKTISTYQRLLASNPHTALARKAALEIGMIYFNAKEYEKAIEAYKNVVAKYRGTEECKTALEGLETLYIEINDVDTYLAYTKSLGQIRNVSTTVREDSISYIVAEKQYSNGKYKQAIAGFKSYLNNYCSGGRYCTNAQYYVADSYYRVGDKQNALIAYRAFLKVGGTQRFDEVVSRCAEITYDNKDFAASMSYFKQLQDGGQTKERKDVGRLGVLRCSFALNDNEATVKIVNEILADPTTNDELKSEAMYNRAKANIELGKVAYALVDLKTLSAETQTPIGAEAKFLLINSYFQISKYKEAENEVLDFAKKNTPHQFWLARSFVVLADVYIKQNNDLQAKQYLLSLQKNYKVQDEIQTLITDRLNSIGLREMSKPIN